MDDLTRPLGQTRAREPARKAPGLLVPLIVGILSLPLAIFAGWAMFVEDRLGGEPVVVGEIRAGATAAGADKQTPVVKVISLPSSVAPQSVSPPTGQTVTIIDGISGRRQEIVVPNSTVMPGAGEPRRSK
jgi:uncharacterized protein